jgi:serine/threonine-protein kinase
VKVLDFGLAKAMGTAEPEGSAPQAATITSPAMMTRAGMILGTAACMSPEQARGRAVDKRADIWAFGVVLHEMLTGKPLFGGESITDTLAAVLTQPIDLAVLPSAVPTPIRKLIGRCLERDPKRRLREVGARPVLSRTGSQRAPSRAR